jgi:hypothetical protein
MVQTGFLGAVGAACFYGLIYLGAVGIAALAEKSKPKTATAISAPCGCGGK